MLLSPKGEAYLVSLEATLQLRRSESQQNYEEVVTVPQLREAASCIKDILHLKILTHTIKFSVSQGVIGQTSLSWGSFDEMRSSAQRLTQVLLW